MCHSQIGQSRKAIHLDIDPGLPSNILWKLYMTLTPVPPSPRGIEDSATEPGLKGLLDLLGDHPSFQQLLHMLASPGGTQPLGVLDAAKPYLLAGLWHHTSKPNIVVVPRPEDARSLYDHLLGYLGDNAELYLFPEPEVLPFERILTEASTTNQRLAALAALHRAEGGPSKRKAPIIVASASAAIFKTISPETFQEGCHILETGSRLRVSDLLERWVRLGYQRDDNVESPGTFSSRGGILDVFSPSSPLPVRIELWGDEIESMRLFDPGRQRSVAPVDSIEVIPAKEILPRLAAPDVIEDAIRALDIGGCRPDVQQRFDDDLESLLAGTIEEDLALYNGVVNNGGLLEHAPPGSILVFDRQDDIRSEIGELTDRAEHLRSTREQAGELPRNFPLPQVTWKELAEAAGPLHRLPVETWAEDTGGLGFSSTDSFFGHPERFAQELPGLLQEGHRVVVVTRYPGRVVELLSDGGIPASALQRLDYAPGPGEARVVSGFLGRGWALPLGASALTVFTDTELFGIAKERRSRSRRTVRREAFLSELVPGSFVVHIDHGVAKFAGTVQMDSDGEPREYLVLEYAEADKLYVPTDQLGRISPYVATTDRPPVLTRLGTADWSRTKERVKHSAQEMARELLDLYAARQVTQGHAFSPDSLWQQELEDSFPYEETTDQRRTIYEMKYEMEQTHPMDRLVCGDVGYGKTEVALRAAFKAVGDNRQVALLVPTTVLAQQHYATFSQRLSPFPIKVEVLSRFRTKREQREVIDGIRSGGVDIIIGTHRLLQKDVAFKDLGLVVVDEEQRFGVAHKERLKQMRREVDMLTLSATPIPRTLHMGLSGIRDMSTIDTAPEDRQPVKTFVSQYKEEVVKEAITRELDRGGQVYYLHNRVNTIGRVAAELARLLPKARFGVAHGRMPEEELEDVMASFQQGDIDVLVCTTIIESGLDIPNANTLVLERADRFGLSQLYQLRGRIGRGSNRAYAYLLLPRGQRITETATKRLKAILEATELGSGYRIALRDLEIRGAGNILGAQQSGHIHAVGFDLYSQLLNEAVAEIKAGEPAGEGRAVEEPALAARVSVPLAAHIPEDYVSHLPTRLAIYQRLSKLTLRQEVDDIRTELQDRFGPPPEPVEELLYLVNIRLLAGEAGVESINVHGGMATLNLVQGVRGARLALEKALGPGVKVGNHQIHIRLGQGDAWKDTVVSALEGLLEFARRLEMTLASS